MSYNLVNKTTGALTRVAGNAAYTDTNGGQYWATCNNQAANQIKIVTVSSDQNFVLEKNAIIFVKFDEANTYTATAEAPVKLNVNGTGDKNVYYANTNTPTGTNTTAFGRQNYINQYIYDGINWVWQGSSSDNDTANKVVQTVTTRNADYEVLFSNTADNTTRTEGARKNNNLKFNPSTGNLQTTKINGVTVGNSPKFTDTADASQINFNKTGTNLNSTQVENAIKEVNTKVNILQSEKADTDIVASDFSASASYTAGNYCVQDGKLYKFKNNHSGAWSSADVDEVKITGELSALKSGLTTLANKAMNPKSTSELATILVAENTKSVTATVNGFVSVKTNNVGTAATTVSCMARNVTQDIGAAATYTVAEFTGAYLICVPVNAGDGVIVDISGHTVDATINQTGTTPS